MYDDKGLSVLETPIQALGRFKCPSNMIVPPRKYYFQCEYIDLEVQ